MSSPFWWGDWRPTLTPHTGNLQPTDLIECTSMLGGVPTNTAITGAQIIAAASGGGATWGGITGTLSSQTDLQGALDNKVPYTGATADVNLGSHDLTATQGTFATGGSSDTLTVNHTSGSGKAITISKAGAGEGIYVNKTSGSGNAVTIVGDLEATTIKKTSGTSSQFLKADGSVDTTTYQATLVSGTNIKTINGNSILGSGDLTVGGSGLAVGTTAITSGTIGRVLFQGTGNVLQQSANLFWDNTNGRLGIGGTPGAFNLDNYGTTRLQNVVTITKGAGNYFTLDAAANGSNLTLQFFKLGQFSVTLSTSNASTIGGYIITDGLGLNGGFLATRLGASAGLIAVTNTGADAQFHVASPNGFSSYLSFRETGNADRGLIGYQNGTSYLQIRTNGATNMSNGTFSTAFFATGNIGINTATNAGYKLDVNGTTRIQSKLSVGTPTAASAVMEVTSTTQGFLPPRMTNAQMLAIATPAAGLVVYDTTNNKHCGYNGTAWQNFY